MSKVMCAIGLMSGTSMDGIDVARIETDGDRILRRFPAITYPYSVDFRARLIEALDIAQTLRGRTARPGALAEIEAVLTTHHADAVTTYLRDSAPMEGPAAVDLIGFHGQTILHRPAERLTVQLGDGPKLATMTGIPVIYDLRAADVAAGGQGAPLACIYHRAMASHVPDRPVAVLNIGGVANVTWVGPGNDLIGFDTGPGNAMIDDWVQSKAGAMRDEDGAFAAQGRISDDIIRTYL
ncbi:MAG TPA: anhydro-N-acetylmuramic acid kinase, partial [Hyphomicrobiaceae bacterium]|nr:anhydro-N-acetylmuramic acid kinase [Hyphomicrobiaceae bacterium]